MKISIVGTVGVPGRYGGFETLVENLVRFHHREGRPEELTVYCSRLEYPEAPPTYLSARLRYVRLNANGPQSIPYDAVSLAHAVRDRADVILLLGVSGTVALPFVRAASGTRIITNVDGLEWKREKWGPRARSFLRWSEKLAVRYSHHVIADNQGIADYLRTAYGTTAELIEYGGDHAVEAEPAPTAVDGLSLPPGYMLALCRIEPENNVAMILEAFAASGQPLVFVGNWDKSEYGRALRARWSGHSNLVLLDPIYDEGRLRRVRMDATAYVHGHSARGTNPALVEMMHFGLPTYAFDCDYNRYTTEDQATYFSTADDLGTLLRAKAASNGEAGTRLREIAQRRYAWARISRTYFDLFARAASARA